MGFRLGDTVRTSPLRKVQRDGLAGRGVVPHEDTHVRRAPVATPTWTMSPACAHEAGEWLTVGDMFSPGQRAAVRSAFNIAGYRGPLRTLAVESEDERWFVLSSEDLERLRSPGDLDQVLTQLLGRKVGVLPLPNDSPTLPFE